MNLPMTCRVDKVETAVYSIVDDVPSVQTALIIQIFVELVVNVSYHIFEAEISEI